MNTHYKIGVGTLFLAILAGISGGIAALFVQLSVFIPSLSAVSSIDFVKYLPQTHARMMVFFVLQPALMLGLGAWFVPVLIKAKDMAFKELNVVSFLCLVLGFLCNFYTFLSPEHSLFVLCSLGFWSLSAILFSINMLITIINNRAIDVDYASLPLFVWGQGIAAALLLPTASILLAALTKVYWNDSVSLTIGLQQIVHFFAHPMVMILVIPAVCLVFHIITIVSNQEITHARAIILGIVMVSFTVLLSWNKVIFTQHSMSANQSFMLQIFDVIALYVLILSLLVYSLKIFFTGQRRYPAPVLWSFGFIGLLVVGWPYQGIIREVGLIHSCISYGVLFAVFAGFYFWMGKILGKQYSELLAQLHFVMTCIGVFFTLDLLSIGERSAFIGSIFLGISLITFIAVLIHALRSKVQLPNNYWGAGASTYEWQLPSPIFSRIK